MSNLPASKRNLTEKQEAFLANVVETRGDLKLAAELAGYSGNHYQIIQSLRQEIVDLASDVLAREAPSAAFKLIELMSTEQSVPQANIKVQAAQTILDRVGVTKKERLDVNHNVTGGIFILPEKQTIDVEYTDITIEED
mgnify:FL=1|jgi:hypothetical protein|tara:strand:- start:3674 stop:4090 length:417 start_codon:yes stop_codon:yes gene_type:complete